MNKLPRKKQESFFANKLGLKIFIEGFIIGMLTLTSFLIGEFVFKSTGIGQTMAFITLSSTQIFHAYNVKSNHSIFSKYSYKNKFMNFAFVIGFVLQFVVVFVPGINSIFKFASLTIVELLIAVGLAFIIVIIMEIVKLKKH